MTLPLRFTGWKITVYLDCNDIKSRSSPGVWDGERDVTVGARRDGKSGKWNWKSVLWRLEMKLYLSNQRIDSNTARPENKNVFFVQNAEHKCARYCKVELLDAESQVCLISSEWSFSSAPCVGIVFDRTIPAMSHLACFFSAPIANE